MGGRRSWRETIQKRSGKRAACVTGVQVRSHSRPRRRIPVRVERSGHVLQLTPNQLLLIMAEKELTIRAQVQWLFVGSDIREIELARGHLIRVGRAGGSVADDALVIDDGAACIDVRIAIAI